MTTAVIIIKIIIIIDSCFYFWQQGLSLGKPQHRPDDGTVIEIGSDANSNSSDSNTFYEEDFSSSDDGTIAP